ncbi:CC_3452 family protein [Alteraurantiacibacter palmitatis]|uniref:Uncharacterized protein n=1 Tax=Alteraurantiacibacter palmitatis TaxID=2054628 RepID=A0ABV7EAX8_9SPHN
MSPLPRIAAFSALAIGAALAPASIAAQAPARIYVAELASPAASANVVAGGLVWRCEGTRCTAPVNGTRALRACREVNRKMGQIVRFEAEGAPLAEADLARCNG